MIFLQDKNRFLKPSDILKRKTRKRGKRNKNGIIKKLSKANGKQKIKFYDSNKIGNSAEELSENRKE